MSSSQRRRFNAFEDFPVEENKTNPGNAGDVPSPSPSVQPKSIPPANVERIERLKPGQMLPDRFQPRRLLPGTIRNKFFTGQIDCYQAARQWLAMAEKDTQIEGELSRLLAMGNSFDEHGQIKPITGSWITQPNGRYVFLIETGERRFWAACLQSVLKEQNEEPFLRVEVVAHPTRQRQVLENRHAEAPSAVGQACEVAALILAELNIPPTPDFQDDFDYFRLAHAQRMPTGLWERITPIMQLTRPRMVQLLNILDLPTPLLELADRSRLPERVLREIRSMPPQQWESAIKASIQLNLTADDVAETRKNTLSSTNEPTVTDPPPAFQPPAQRVAMGGLRRFANVLGDLDEISQAQALEEIANMLVKSGQAQGVRALLDELSRLIDLCMKQDHV